MFITCVTSRYLPNLIYIARLLEVDCPVTLDLASLPNQYKDSFISRNRILNKIGNTNWLSVPVCRKGVEYIKDAQIDITNKNWIDKHIKSIAHLYPDHKKVSGNFLVDLRSTLETSDGTLTDLNNNTLKLILRTINFEYVNPILESSLIRNHNKQHRLHLSQVLNADTYVAGHVEWEIMKKSGLLHEMEKNGIKVIRSPNLDLQGNFNNSIISLSSIHFLCTIGTEKTHNLVKSMVAELYQKRNTY